MAQGSGRDFEDVPDRPSPFSLYPWLLIGWGTASDAAGGKFHPAWLAAAGLAAFAGLYVAAIWARWRTARPRASYWLLAALGLVTLGLNLAFGPDMTALFPLLTIACGAVVPWLVPFKGGHGPPLPLLVVFVVAAASSLIAAQQGASAGDIWSDWYGPTLSGLIVAVLYRFMEAVAELRRTREELARSAVDAERLRFARDMHDLLGHTLSVMVVKAQVARKLASRDPAQAAQQAMDIEEIGRGALSEVRQAVAGYRGRGLARELEAARAALADAGVTVEVRQDGPPVPAGADTLLGLGGARGRHQRHPAQRRAPVPDRGAQPGRAGHGRGQRRRRRRAGADRGGGARRRRPVRRARAGRAAGTARRRRRHAGGRPAARRRLLPHRRRPGPGSSGSLPVIRVLLAEDQGMMRGALALLLGLEDDIEVVAQVESGDRVLAAALGARPDVALLDIEMPGRSGLDVAADLRARLPGCKVLMLTTFGRPGYLRRAMEAGASGFLIKDGPVEELADAIRKVLAGQRVMDPALAAAALAAGPSPLTEREREVLRAAGGGTTVADIAARLFLSESTVRNYLSSAIGKTSARNRTEAAETARCNGWL